jgi:hypothetical protein
MSQHGVWLPRRVQAGVISETFGDGTAVVVQLDSQQAHSLDALAAKVWELADGTRSVSAVALAAGVPAERVEATLAQLDGLGLLEDAAVGGHSRRSVLARAAQVGGGLVLAGGIVSMALPAAAAAVTNVLQSVAIAYMSGYYTYQDGGTPTYFGSPICLTDSGVVTTEPSSGPFVSIQPGSGGGLKLTFSYAAGATASYGNGTSSSSATMSLMAGSQTSASASSTLWVTIGT